MSENEEKERIFRESDFSISAAINHIIYERRLSRRQVILRAGLQDRFLEKLESRNGMQNIDTSTLFRLCKAMHISAYEFFYILQQQYEGKLKYRLPRTRYVDNSGLTRITNGMMLTIFPGYKREAGYPSHDIHKDSEITVMSFLRTAIRYKTTFHDAYNLLIQKELEAV